jgi:hypothetical protein
MFAQDGVNHPGAEGIDGNPDQSGRLCELAGKSTNLVGIVKKPPYTWPANGSEPLGTFSTTPIQLRSALSRPQDLGVVLGGPYVAKTHAGQPSMS